MNNKIIEYLREQGYKPYNAFYNTIQMWINMWKGKTEFHKYKVVYDNKTYDREMYSLSMEKRICEDWASICWSEKDQIKTTNKNQTYLDKKLNEIKFNNQSISAIEKSCYSGTCGAILRVKNIKLLDNQLITDKFSKYDLILMNASRIIPLRTEQNKIIDCAFISETRIEDKLAYYIEIHELVRKKDEQGEEYETYRIRNKYIDKEGKEVEKNGVIKEYYTGSDIALFSILRPPIDNPYEEANGLGFSMYGNAIDQLHGADIAYNNFVMDYYLGGKKVFYNKKLTRRDDKGNIIYPDDVSKQQFQIVGDEMENVNADGLIHEYNPDLRIEDNKSGLQFFLDLLSFKCGLGTKYYQFDGGSGVVTATQYMGDRQDLTINAKKYRENVDEFVVNICRGILLLGRLLFKENVNETDEIKVVNTDGFLISEEDLKEKYLNEIAQGLRSKVSYMVKFMGMTEEEAKRELTLINEEDAGVFEEGE